MEEEIDPKIRLQVLFENGMTSPITLSNTLGMPLRTAERYVAKLRRGESLDRKAYSKRAGKVTANLRAQVIRKAVKSKKVKSSRQIGHSVGLSHTSVLKILDDRGFKYCRSKKTLIITPEDQLKRQDFAREMVNRESDWPYMFITDECSIWIEKTVPRGTWAQAQGEAMEEEVKEENYRVGQGRYGAKVHLWAGISARGATKIYIFQNNLTSKRYRAILRKGKRDMDRLYPEGYIFQQDNSPIHTAKIITRFIDANFPMTINWPAYSPDISPIENIWGWLKAEVGKDRPSTIEGLKRSIRKHWYSSVNEEFLANYFTSMNKRMMDVIENRGAKINY